MENEKDKLIKRKYRKRKKKNNLLKLVKANLFKFTYNNVFLLIRILFLIANSIYFIINISFLNHTPNKEILKFINNNTIFKNIDNYILSLLTNSYEKIGNYLNNKYNINYN